MTVTPFEEDSVPGVPVDTVVAWTEGVTEIPDEWALCDGNNGTPDLRGEFVRSVSSSSVDPGTESGGQSSWSLDTTTMPSHDHNVTTDSVGDHNHSMDIGSESSVVDDGQFGYDFVEEGTDQDVDSAGSHSHYIDTGLTGTSFPSSVNNTPQYYSVTYIMKL